MSAVRCALSDLPAEVAGSGQSLRRVKGLMKTRSDK
jgi:hypothetical protein